MSTMNDFDTIGQCVLCLKPNVVNSLNLCEECYCFMDRTCSH